MYLWRVEVGDGKGPSDSLETGPVDDDRFSFFPGHTFPKTTFSTVSDSHLRLWSFTDWGSDSSYKTEMKWRCSDMLRLRDIKIDQNLNVLSTVTLSLV